MTQWLLPLPLEVELIGPMQTVSRKNITLLPTLFAAGDSPSVDP